MTTLQSKIQLPDKARFLLQDRLPYEAKDCRYYVLHGGRNSAKSHSVARALLVRCMEKKQLILCGREIQLSIKDSVHALLSNIIIEHDLQDEYEIGASEIIGKNGTRIFYSGLHHHMIGRVKSTEAVDLLWFEEAQTASDRTWQVLLPTIRKKNSKIFVTMNPDLEDDPSYERFVKNPRDRSLVVQMNYTDNPWYYETEGEDERLNCLKFYPELYENIWLGKPRTLAEGAVFGKEMELAYADNRIGVYDYDPKHPVFVAFDIGVSDATAVWFGQRIGSRFRMIDYMEMTDVGAPQFVKMLKEKPYVYGSYHAPHDAKQREWGSGGLSPKEILRNYGISTRDVPFGSISDRIHAGRMFIANCEFDAVKCAEGIRALRNWKWDIKKTTQMRRETPLHDWASHGADAFTYFAVSASDMHVFSAVYDLSDIVYDFA